MSPRELADYADVMRAKGIVEFTVNGASIKLGQVLPAQELVIPPIDREAAARAAAIAADLMRPMSDEELLLFSAPQPAKE